EPLISEKRFAPEVAVCATEIFAERIQAAKQFPIFRRAEAGDEHPFFLIGMKPEPGVVGVIALGFCGDEKLLRLARFPRINQMRMPAGSFVTEIARNNALSFSEELHAIFVGDF